MEDKSGDDDDDDDMTYVEKIHRGRRLNLEGVAKYCEMN